MHSRLLVLTLALLTFLVGGMVSGKVLSFPPVRAQQPTQVKPEDAPKWEYCFVSRPVVEEFKVTGRYISLVFVCYMQGVGCRKERIEVEVEDKSSFASLSKAKEEALSKAFARLGDDRWEVVGRQEADLDLEPAYKWLFKRPKQ